MYKDIERQFKRLLSQRASIIAEAKINLESSRYEGVTKGTIKEELLLWEQFYQETKRTQKIARVYNFFFNSPIGRLIENNLTLSLDEIAADQAEVIKRIPDRL